MRVCSKTWRGFTLIELMVVLAVISVLLALLLPAVQSTRQQARAVQCLSRLRQIGIAAHSYADVNGGFLPPSFEPILFPNGQMTNRNLSLQAQLLPYLEMKDLYDRIDLREDGRGGEDEPIASKFNSELISFSVTSFQCPSDDAKPGSNNYRGCDGARPNYFGGLTGVSSGYYRLRDIRDGLSTTAFCSERVTGDRDSTSYDATRDIAAGVDSPTTPSEQLESCRQTSLTPASHKSWLGATWLISSRTHTLYTHTFTPNSSVPDCNAVASARSWHPGRVNLLLCDGSARPVSNNVDSSLWISLSTPLGKESISEF